jgi:hypothetical protein
MATTEEPAAVGPDRRTVLRFAPAAAIGMSALTLPSAAAHGSGDGTEAGPLAVGGSGPAGGMIVLTPDSIGGDGTHFYEAAPSDATTAGGSATMPWISVAGNSLFGVMEARVDDVGAGSANTSAMLLAGDTGGAAHAADRYEHGGYADWFLPSRNELAAMIAVPGVSETLVGGAGYWSSTEASNGITAQSLAVSGELRAIAKPEPYRTRPLRRFAG